MALAHSTEQLRRLAGGRSVYSDKQLQSFGATDARPVKVINFLLVTHISPVLDLARLQRLGVIAPNPQQSVFGLTHDKLASLLLAIPNLGFRVLP